MIVEYHRPKTLAEALDLLAQSQPTTRPLGGGTVLNQPSREEVAVVDLQSLGLDRVAARGITLEVGATTTLESLLAVPELPPALGPVIRSEASYNLRQIATLAGTLVAADGRSPLTTALLCLDAGAMILPGEREIHLGDLLPLREELLPGHLIVRIVLPTNARLGFEAVARTPADRPLICVAAAQWPSGRTRVAVGGFGMAPSLAFDGPDASGAVVAAKEACSHSGDQWASAAYRQTVAGILTTRLVGQLSEN